MAIINDEFVEHYRDLLNETVELSDAATNRETSIVNSFSMEDRFYLAKNLLNELDYLRTGSGHYPSNFARFFSAALLDALISPVKVSNEEWQYVVDNCSLHLLSDVIKSPSFPVEILISEKAFEEHFTNPLFPYFQFHFDRVISARFPEIVHYFRSMVPNSEHMSDEMVLSVAGVSF